MTPTFFSKQADFRKWLEKNHGKKTELLVGFYKVDSGKPSMSWPQSVDEALCFGWIDGVRRSIDGGSYTIRFTPRKATSVWSAVNIKKIEVLTKQGLMRPAGIAAFEKRKESKSKIYSYENEAVKLDAKFEKEFKANKKAWKFFQSEPAWYHKQAIYWVMGAKQASTRESRMGRLIRGSESGRRV